VSKARRVPCANCNEYAADNSLPNGAQITLRSAAVRNTEAERRETDRSGRHV
jgi:hypothetical protein